MRLPRITLNRHLIITVICVALVFTAGVLSNKAWNSNVVKTQVASAKQKAIETDRKRRQANAVAAERTRLKTECDKEVAYYNSLTVAQKAKQTAPACQNLQPVQ